MLEVYAINIVVPTQDGDFYGKVAINTHPIILLGREDDLKRQLASRDVIDYCKHKFRNTDLYEQAEYHIIHCKRDNTCDKMVWKLSETTKIE